MVIFDPKAHVSFKEYGITIPSLDSRKTLTVSSLKKMEVLEKNMEKWLISEITPAVNRSDIQRVHTAEYVNKLYGTELEECLTAAYELFDENGNYNRYNPENAVKPLRGLLYDILNIVSGTYLTIQTALEKDFCYFLGGGMHHAHPGSGHGFCLVNDVAISLMKAKAEGLIETGWIIDLDAHRGDGTADIFSRNPDFTTMSMHMAHGWPLDSEKYDSGGTINPAWIPGDIDIPIESGEEDMYVSKLKKALEKMETEYPKPDIAVVLGGADPYEFDELPSTSSLNMTKEQLLERDSLVYRWLREREIPGAWMAAGGYGKRSWEIHTGFLSLVIPERL